MFGSTKFSLLSVICFIVSTSTLPVTAQQTQSTNTVDLDSAIQSVRADIRADKILIITDAMKFTPQEANVFWPVYKKYEYDLSGLNDERVQLIKSYAEKYSTLNDADAKQLADKSFDLESRRVSLRKQYFKEFNKQLPATTVAKFFQLEHRLDLLIDLKLASELPALLAKPATSAQTTNP